MQITLALVAGEIADAGKQRWWAARPFTTDTVPGLLVLLITVLVVNQLLISRQARQRGHAVAAQAAIMTAQANWLGQSPVMRNQRTGRPRCRVRWFRTYMMMLLTDAPVLIDDPLALQPEGMPGNVVVARNLLDRPLGLLGVGTFHHLNGLHVDFIEPTGVLGERLGLKVHSLHPLLVFPTSLSLLRLELLRLGSHREDA
jgi:hypothetical protein